MKRQTVLLTGGTGLLAVNWACALRANHNVVLGTHSRGIELKDTSATTLPLDDTALLCRTFERLRPDIVVHTAGLTSVEQCEKNPELARHVYADLSGNVAKAAARVGARLISISTDHLFSGAQSLYDESSVPEPLNAYGRSKLLGEEAVTEVSPDALIVRTNFFGWGHRYRRSFSDWIYYSLRDGIELTMFDDVFVTPMLADALALSAHALLDTGATGIYNVVSDERISKFDFAIRLARTFELPEKLIRRGKIALSQLSVKRPPDMSLDNRRTRLRLGTDLGTIDDYLATLKQQDLDGRRAELLSAVSE